jgi:DNA-directed RNA polymerase subunit RPC12/RpoP
MSTEKIINKAEGNAVLPLVSNSTEIVEMFVRKWRNTDKYPCPKCGSKLGMPDYKCEKCSVKIKLKMQF